MLTKLLSQMWPRNLIYHYYIIEYIIFYVLIICKLKFGYFGINLRAAYSSKMTVKMPSYLKKTEKVTTVTTFPKDLFTTIFDILDSNQWKKDVIGRALRARQSKSFTWAKKRSVRKILRPRIRLFQITRLLWFQTKSKLFSPIFALHLLFITCNRMSYQ